jgi:hypothetical protein
MEGLPQHRQRVKVWPNPKRRVQASELSISIGGRWMAPEGETVTWSIFRHKQLLAGEIYFHDPRSGVATHPDAASLRTDVEVAERRAQAAEAAKDEAARALADANAAAARAKQAADVAQAAHEAAMKSSQALLAKVNDRAPVAVEPPAPAPAPATPKKEGA